MIKQLKKIKRKVVTFFQTPQEKRHALVGPAKLWKMKQDFQINFLKSKGLQAQSKINGYWLWNVKRGNSSN